MPQIMTEEEASKVLCPHMSRSLALADGRVTFEPITCQGHDCACWGWVDGERGQLDVSPRNQETEKKSYFMKSDEFRGDELSPPDGDGWREAKTIHYPDRYSIIWVREPVIGPRRGQCEAMSPNITVETG